MNDFNCLRLAKNLRKYETEKFGDVYASLYFLYLNKLLFGNKTRVHGSLIVESLILWLLGFRTLSEAADTHLNISVDQ